jgi:hypothetical protein
MDMCGNCGRIRKQGATFCNGCGSRFPDSEAPAGPYGSAEPYRPSRSHQTEHSRRAGIRLIGLTFPTVVVAMVAVVFVAAAAAGGALLFTRHHGSRGETALSPNHSTRTIPQASPVTDAGSSAPAQNPSATSPSPLSSGVSVGAGASQDPAASSVAAFLGQYFAAINGHDYQSYLTLLSPQLQQAMTQAEFNSGYQSTVDSNETLVGISTASDGDLAAEVTFTSHQNPADSPNHSEESCTNWDISLFFAQSGSGYVIDLAPPGYKASYQACS